MRIEKNVDLKKYSYIKIGGMAEKVIIIENYEDLKYLSANKDDYFVLGNCSNILFGEKNISRTFVRLDGINEIKDLGEGIIEVGGGLKFSNFISFLNKNNYGGLEQIAGIPGTVGGLTAINAGAYGLEIFSKIIEVEYLDKDYNVKRKLKEDIDFSYRNTEFKQNNNIIIKVKFQLEKGYNVVKVLELLNKRKEKQPLEYPNIGSIFKNPENDYAARLIEEVGLKGYSIGDAEISCKHSNFIVNKGMASYEDVMDLIELCKKKVYEKFKILLKEEIIIVN